MEAGAPPRAYDRVSLDAWLWRVHPGLARFLPEAEPLVTQIVGRAAALPLSDVDPKHAGDLALARACYAACRAVRPTHVVETGVAQGVTSFFILSALEANGHGELHSIDLPPLADVWADKVGVCVPTHLHHRWRLHRGTTRRVLRPLLRDLQRVGVFVHDSLHTYSTMTFELQAIVPYLTRPAVVVADDIDRNEAFFEFERAAAPSSAAAILEAGKNTCFGVALFGLVGV